MRQWNVLIGGCDEQFLGHKYLVQGLNFFLYLEIVYQSIYKYLYEWAKLVNKFQAQAPGQFYLYFLK